MTALWFSSALVEEVSKTDSNSIKRFGSHELPVEVLYSLTDSALPSSQSYHEKILLNAKDAVSIIRSALDPAETGGRDEALVVKLRTEAIKCFQVWLPKRSHIQIE